MRDGYADNKSQTHTHGTYVDVNCRHFISEFRRFLLQLNIAQPHLLWLHAQLTTVFAAFSDHFCSFAWNIRQCQPRKIYQNMRKISVTRDTVPSLAQMSLERRLECGIYWKMAHSVDWCALFRFIAVNFYGRCQHEPMLPSFVRDHGNCCVFRNMAGYNVRWTLWQWQTK